MTGADVMVKCLEKKDIHTVFGYPGVAICPFFDSLYRSDIDVVLVRAEQNGGHMASGYARVTRKPAVAVATSGPGATNLITAIATAYADSIPLIAITGQVETSLLGRDVFQEADITGACEPFVKYSYLVRDPADIPRIFEEAFYIASTGRRGPVLIDVPVDIQNKASEYVPAERVSLRGYKPTVKGNDLQINKVIETLTKAKRPLICTGGGTILANAEDEMKQFIDRHNIPAVSTMMGIGALPSDDPHYMGMLGTNGKPYANYAVAECDVLMLVGARVADRAVVKPYKLERRNTTIIHIDVDPAEIGKNLGTTIPLVGDIKVVMQKLLERDFESDYSEWTGTLEQKKADYVPNHHFNPDFVDPCLFVKTLSSMMEDDAVYVADVGQNQLWSADNYVMKHGRFLTTGGFGTMSYSIPAAMGARAAFPDKQVIAVCGDGSFQMAMMELSTMQHYGLHIKFVIMHNGYLGLVREYQHHNYDDRYSGTNLGEWPDFAKLADAYGIGYFHLTSNSGMEDTIREFLAAEGSGMMVCEVYPYDLVKE
ncbi:MAG: biosynthetic-type acetolactate synthase large subunit [Lachnospiraceae bacterium]|nr:biosynthetic-type acetolactate synthase large subunit [Lachnospiraceae bacterium]